MFFYLWWSQHIITFFFMITELNTYYRGDVNMRRKKKNEAWLSRKSKKGNVL